MSAAAASAAFVTLAVLCWPRTDLARALARTRQPVGEPAVRPAGGHAASRQSGTPHQVGPTAPPGAPSSFRAECAAVVRSVTAALGRRGPPEPDLPAMIDALAAALRTGLPVPDALASVHQALAQPARTAEAGSTPAGQATAGALLEGPLVAARSGRSVASAFHRLARDRGLADMAMVARAWELSERSGAAIAEGLGLAAEAGRYRREVRRKVAAATAGARATSMLLTALPLSGILLAGMTGSTVVEVYRDPVALISAGLGLGLLVLGRRVVRRQIARVEAGV